MISHYFEIVSYYEKKDTEFTGDYASVEVYYNLKLIRDYGDSYHDDGLVKAESFVEGYKAALKALGETSIVVEHKDKNLDYNV